MSDQDEMIMEGKQLEQEQKIQEQMRDVIISTLDKNNVSSPFSYGVIADEILAGIEQL